MSANTSWEKYSKKLIAKIEKPRSFGFFAPADAEKRQMRCVVGKEGLVIDGNALALYWLVDPTDGVIVDAKFQVFGQSALIGAAEAACDLLIGKNYDQAKRVSADLIDKQLRDKPDEAAFPKETLPHLNLVIDAIDDAAEQCLDISLPDNYITPMPRDLSAKEGGGFPGWLTLSKEQKLAVIEEVLNEEVRPYVELDAGGIEIVDLIEERELKIAYQGACTSCFSAVGTTLSTIQQIMRAKVHPSISVVPDMENLKF